MSPNSIYDTLSRVGRRKVKRVRHFLILHDNPLFISRAFSEAVVAAVLEVVAHRHTNNSLDNDNIVAGGIVLLVNPLVDVYTFQFHMHLLQE